MAGTRYRLFPHALALSDVSDERFLASSDYEDRIILSLGPTSVNISLFVGSMVGGKHGMVRFRRHHNNPSINEIKSLFYS